MTTVCGCLAESWPSTSGARTSPFPSTPPFPSCWTWGSGPRLAWGRLRLGSRKDTFARLKGVRSTYTRRFTWRFLTKHSIAVQPKNLSALHLNYTELVNRRILRLSNCKMFGQIFVSSFQNKWYSEESRYQKMWCDLGTPLFLQSVAWSTRSALPTPRRCTAASTGCWSRPWTARPPSTTATGNTAPWPPSSPSWSGRRFRRSVSV